MKFYTSVDVVGNSVCLRGFENDVRFSKRVKYKPSLYLDTTQPSQYKSLLKQKPLEKCVKTISEYRMFIKNFNESGLDIHGTINPEYQFISDEYGIECKYDVNKLRIANLDIETAVGDSFPHPDLAEQKVTGITVLIRGDRKYSFGCGDFTPKSTNDYYFKFKNEADMLEGFLKFWKADYPDIITGWNTKMFDIPYLVNRITKKLSPQDADGLSPWRRIWSQSQKNKWGNQENYYRILGIQHLDLMEVYKKNILNPRDSYKLDYIAQVELGRKKIDYSEYGSLHKLYLTNYQLYMEYNQEDCQLVEDIDLKLNLIDFTVMMGLNFGVNYEDVASQVRCWDVLIYNTLKKDDIVIPPKKTNVFIRKYEGGYVKDPLVGLHDWVCSYDLASLYPSIIRQLNISPETMRDNYDDCSVDGFIAGVVPAGIEKDNVTISPNGQSFTKDFEGFLPKLLAKLGDDRVEYKKEMFKYERLALQPDITDEQRSEYKALKQMFNMKQKGVKVASNSAYGALGNLYGRYYSLAMAEGITLFGQLVLKKSMIDVNTELNRVLKTDGYDYVIAADTDSHYFRLSNVFGADPNMSNKVDVLDRFGNTFIEPCFKKCFEGIYEMTNSYKNMMVMKRENIAERGIWTKKKKYVLKVWDSEGTRYIKPEYKIMGLEAIRSTTPEVVRGKIKQALKIMLNDTNEDLIKFVNDFEKEFSELPYIDVSENIGVNGIRKNSHPQNRYVKGTPHHVKASIGYNIRLEEMGLLGKYEPITDGTKIKLLMLKNPNPMYEEKIGYVNNIPVEFALDAYIDYRAQFIKTFLNPITKLTDIIGWTTKKIYTLDFVDELE